MRHLIADAMTRYRGLSPHLQATAKVQIFVERSKSGRGAEVERSGACENDIMKAISAARMAKCQRAESPSMHKV